VILARSYEEIPMEVERLIRVSIETGAALAGLLQTANVGIEKIICNVVANPNIRYLVLAGQESRGHYPGDALRALIENGADGKGNIVGTKAPIAHVSDLPSYVIERFRKQTSIIDLLDITDPEVVKQALWASYQESPTTFKAKGKEYQLHDPGVFPGEPFVYQITDKLKEKVYQLFKAEISKATERAKL
jgi:tetrahydromethanopterin S-methyltransferase subunit A